MNISEYRGKAIINKLAIGEEGVAFYNIEYLNYVLGNL